MKTLILASTSRYRCELLARLCVPFSARPHGLDESALKEAFFLANPVGTETEGDLAHKESESGQRGGRLAVHLAEQKARAIASSAGGAWVLGSDQLATLKGEVLGKPGTLDRARDQLRKLAGQTHLLCTGTALICPDGSIHTSLDVHRMTMRPLTDDEIARYLEIDAPMDCAGSYKIERAGISLFDRIAGDDFTAITGLPLLTVTRLLQLQGFPLPGPAPRAAEPAAG